MEYIALLGLIALYVVIWIGTREETSETPNKIDPEVREMRRVYIMRGSTKMTQVKIGYSARLNDKRKDELRRSSGIDLEMIAEVSCNYSWHLEQQVHKTLSRFESIQERTRKNRMKNEWYTIPVRGQPSVIIMIEEIAASLAETHPGFRFDMQIHSKALQRWMPAARLKRTDLKSESDGMFYFELESPK